MTTLEERIKAAKAKTTGTTTAAGSTLADFATAERKPRLQLLPVGVHEGVITDVTSSESDTRLSFNIETEEGHFRVSIEVGDLSNPLNPFPDIMDALFKQLKEKEYTNPVEALRKHVGKKIQVAAWEKMGRYKAFPKYGFSEANIDKTIEIMLNQGTI